MKRIAWFLFLTVSIGELVSQFIDTGWIHHVCKPLIMVSLGMLYFASVPGTRRSWIVVGAIFFSFLGDSLLMYDHLSEVYFMAGLGAFLVAQLCYIIAYRQHRDEKRGSEITNVQRVRLAFPVVLAGTGLVFVLYPKLGELLIPVMLYALVLILMVLSALGRLGRTIGQSFWMVFAGAVSFMVSDSLLAINKFLQPVGGDGIWIMLTYITAQLLIINGIIKHANHNETPYA